MNWDRVKGNWKQWKGRVRAGWGKLTDDQPAVVAGRSEICAGRLQEAYGIGREEAGRSAGATVDPIRKPRKLGKSRTTMTPGCIESTQGNDPLPNLRDLTLRGMQS